jgi:ferredoxin
VSDGGGGVGHALSPLSHSSGCGRRASCSCWSISSFRPFSAGLPLPHLKARNANHVLKDPAIQRSNEFCGPVHCGFCTATCPTYQVLGDELDSPRGRIYLIKDMLETGRPADEKTVKHIDRCLSCLACMTTCPSGVHYMHLVDHAREYIEQTYKRPLFERVLRWTLARILPYPTRFRVALLGAKIGRPFAFLMPDARLKAMLAMAPKQDPAGQPQRRSAGVPGEGRAQDARGADDRLRAAGAQHRHQRCHDPASDAAGLRRGDRRGAGVLRGADPSHGQDEPKAMPRRRRTSAPGIGR